MEKRLYKSKYGNKIDGVCKGIAEYFEIDSTIVRLLWVVIGLFNPPAAVIGYIVALLIIPREPHSA